jgi:hypothetical protein
MAAMSRHSFNIEPYWFQRRRFLNIFPIGPYVKTMFADGCHLGWRSGSQEINLKVDHLRTIHAMFALKSNIAARVHNVFSLAEILKIFLSETTKSIKSLIFILHMFFNIIIQILKFLNFMKTEIF